MARSGDQQLTRRLEEIAFGERPPAPPDPALLANLFGMTVEEVQRELAKGWQPDVQF